MASGFGLDRNTYFNRDLRLSFLGYSSLEKKLKETKIMTVQEARKIIEEIHERYGIQFSETQEKRENGRIHTIYVTLKFKVDPGTPRGEKNKY